MTLGLADRSNMQTPFFLRGHTPQGLEGPRSHCGVCSEAPRVIYVSVLNHIVNASTYLCVINDIRYLAPGQSRNYTPNGLPRDQTNGAKLREPPAGKRPREPTRTSRNADAGNGPGTQHQALDQSRSYAPNGPPQHAAIRQASQPGSQASQRRKPPSEPGQRATTTIPAAKATLFFCATNRRNPSANLMRSPWWRALSQITLPCALKRHATVLRDHTTMCCVYVRHK